MIGSQIGTRRVLSLLFSLLLVSCTTSAPPPAPAARSFVLVTIDTMRADHVGAYGYAAARTPALDRIAHEGARFDRAFATAPITLTSHASLLTGRYPPGHRSRDNGMAVAATVPTLAGTLHDRGFATAAFVAAFPLDHRFGLARGFDVYGDRMPRGPDGRLANERPAREVVDEAIAWLASTRRQPVPAGNNPRRVFLWVHLFEPHAPYGDPAQAGGRPALERYDDEIAIADRETGRLLESLRPDLHDTLLVVASDHGEAFGEHGEIGHSLFVYDTTLRVALLMRGPGVPSGRAVRDPVSLIDVAPTVLRLLGLPPLDTDGIDLRPALLGTPLAARDLYAESFAPLVDFGWSALRTVRQGRWKAIAAPRPELYDTEADAAEERDLSRGASSAALNPDLARLLARIGRFSGPEPRPASASPAGTEDAAGRLGALGYVQGSRAPAGARADPKDHRDLAARIASVTSGEAQGDALLSALESIVREDPGNAQMQLRLGDTLVGRGREADAAPHFRAAIDARLPSADPYLGLALCQARRGAVGEALATLHASEAVEADNPVVLANIGLLEARGGRPGQAIAALRQALTIDPEFLEARFNLALAYARAGRRAEALAETRDLLSRLPASAPQRPEVERLLEALRQPSTRLP